MPYMSVQLYWFQNVKYKSDKLDKNFTTLVQLVTFTTTLFGQTGLMTVEQIFNEASHIDGFQKVEYMPDDIKFPKEIGKPEMIIHGNAEPRSAILYSKIA